MVKVKRSAAPLCMEITPLGDCALIVRVRDDFQRDPNDALDAVLNALRRIENAHINGVVELVPAYTTVTVFYDLAAVITAGADSAAAFDSIRAKIARAIATELDPGTEVAAAEAIDVPICADGEFALDLTEIATRAGMEAETFLRRVLAANYRVACIGFAPGFPYLSGLPGELATPRRASPRKRVPRGSVAIGGAQIGIYPQDSPGGWNVIGRTPLRLFDADRNPPVTFSAGDHVRFRLIDRKEFDELSR